MNIIGKPSAIGDLSAIFAAAEVNRCSSPAISPAAAAPMSEVIDRTKVKKSPTAAINGRRRMLDPHNVRAATRDKRPPAKTVDQAALPMLVKERRTSPIAQEGRTLPIAQAFVLVKEGRTSLTAEALIAVWAAYEHRPAVFGSRRRTWRSRFWRWRSWFWWWRSWLRWRSWRRSALGYQAQARHRPC